METVKVEIREFRDKLSSFVLDAATPLAITRHGDTLGYFIPARPCRNEIEREALRKASARIQSDMVAQGVTEDEILEDYRKWKANERK